MKVKDLLEKLKELDQDLEVFFRCPHLTGNIKAVGRANKDTYGFFGTSIDCIILDEIEEENEK